METLRGLLAGTAGGADSAARVESPPPAAGAGGADAQGEAPTLADLAASGDDWMLHASAPADPDLH